MRGMVALGAAVALLASPVSATCWTKDEAAAAGVRQLQSMLMVAALRCEAGGTRLMGDYNGFVAANRIAITAENDRLRMHFINAMGALGGQRAYDSFTTSLANAYGAGEGAPRTCADVASLAHEAGAAANSRDSLLMLVDELGLAASLPEGRCEAQPPVTVAVASAATMPKTVLADASRYAGIPAPIAASYSPADYDPR